MSIDLQIESYRIQSIFIYQLKTSFPELPSNFSIPKSFHVPTNPIVIKWMFNLAYIVVFVLSSAPRQFKYCGMNRLRQICE